jgi:hypothetical protein
MGDHAIPTGLREAVRRTGASASFRPLRDALHSALSAGTDAVVVVVPDDIRQISHSLQVLLDRLADQPRATLLMRASGGDVPHVGHPRTVPVTFGCPANADELATRLCTMVAMRDSLESLHGSMVANRQSEQNATQRYNNQLRLASQIQRDLIPETLPTIGSVSFSAVFRPVDYVSGDIYDVHRLDEQHVAVALADATGHGIPAALLTMLIKRSLRGKEIDNGHYRILRPEEVLARLNEDLLYADLSDCSFVAATYAVLNVETLELKLARGGSPYPLLRRANGAIELLQPAGGVVGITAGAEFEVETVQLAPGDTLLICSDGLDRVLIPQLPNYGLTDAFARTTDALRRRAEAAAQLRPAVAAAAPCLVGAGVSVTDGGWQHNGNGNGRPASAARSPDARTRSAPTPRGVATTPGQALLASAWCETLRDEGPAAALDELQVRHETLRRIGHPLDDLTVLAMHVCA